MGGFGRAEIADRLAEYADLLEAQDANRFRVRAYRAAAGAIRTSRREPAAILEEEGLDGLIAIRAIGESIARAIAEMVESGRWNQLDRLRGRSEPEDLFIALPGVGPKTARLIHDNLHVDTLEGLEVAAHDGRLEGLPGIGPRRAAQIRDSLAQRLARRGRAVPRVDDEPPVDLLLRVDAEYRDAAGKDLLRRIAPRRFNPEGTAWLPIMHVERDGWQFTALFSNTALAHELGRTSDWVVLYFHREHGPEHQRTVVTETRGEHRGRRVVRGREDETPRTAPEEQ